MCWLCWNMHAGSCILRLFDGIPFESQQPNHWSNCISPVEPCSSFTDLPPLSFAAFPFLVVFPSRSFLAFSKNSIGSWSKLKFIALTKVVSSSVHIVLSGLSTSNLLCFAFARTAATAADIATSNQAKPGSLGQNGTSQTKNRTFTNKAGQSHIWCSKLPKSWFGLKNMLFFK